MDGKTLIATASAIFLADMGDKTQFAVFGAAAATRKPLEVFLGAVAGLVLVTRLATVLGHTAGQMISPKLLRMPNWLRGCCGVCEFRTICGGSRARAYAMTGDYLAEEPCRAHVSRALAHEATP